MDSDSMKKYSDKLFFALVSGEDLDDEDLQEITKHMIAEDAEKKAKAKEESGSSWSIAYDKKDALRLLPGEYPRLFNKKMKVGEEDKFSENVFNVSDAKGPAALFVPTPASLLLGDLLRANKDTKKSLNVQDTLAPSKETEESEFRVVYDDEDEDASFETFDNVEDLVRDNLDFSGFRAPEVPSTPVSKAPEASVRAEEKPYEPTLAETLTEFGTNVVAVGALLAETIVDLGKGLLWRYWQSKRYRNDNE